MSNNNTNSQTSSSSNPAPKTPEPNNNNNNNEPTIPITTKKPSLPSTFIYSTYKSEQQLKYIKSLMDVDLSEPYSVFTYRYFINNWPELCIVCHDGDLMIGAIVCKCDRHKSGTLRGYIAMVAVHKQYRKQGIGSQLVVKIIQEMQRKGCDEVVLETEVTNKGALALYRKLGFIKDKRMHKYYLNGGDAFRLKLFLQQEKTAEEELHQVE